MRGTRVGLALLGVAAVIVPMAAGPAAADATSVTVGSVTVGGTSISVGGTITFGTDATNGVTLGTDAAGDALVTGAGLDLKSISVRPNIAARQLVWTLATNDGVPEPVGVPPGLGFQVPITVDGQDWWRWLGAGTAGTANAQLGEWTALCHNEVNGAQGGWSCPGLVFGSTNTFTLAGSITATGVTWTQGFSQMKPQISYGSVVEQGSILCARPCSFTYPPGLALGGLQAVDAIDTMAAYKVPGAVELGIAPAGTPPSSVNFSATGTFNGTTGAFTGSVSKPGTAGAYTVYAKTCFGIADALTCAIGSSDVTV